MSAGATTRSTRRSGCSTQGCYLRRRDWQRLAAQRIGRLVARSISSQGVSNEQSIRYDLYDYLRFVAARDHLRACGYPVPRDFERVRRMPTFLAHATRPDGRYETLGDTTDRDATAIKGTPAEFAATGGTQGIKPSTEIDLQARVCVRSDGLGRGPALRGRGVLLAVLRRRHADPRSRRRRFGDPVCARPPAAGRSGLRGLQRVDVECLLRSRRAHNTVIAQRVRSRASRPTLLERRSITARSVELVVRVQAYPGAVHRRRVIFSRRSGYLVVEDTIESSVGRTWRQLWHLRERSRPVTHGRRTWTRTGSSDLLIQQLIDRGATVHHQGEQDPVHGWILASLRPPRTRSGHRARVRGRSVRFVTVLAPFSGGVRPTVSAVRLTRRGFSFVIEADGRRERVRATATGASITDER